MPRKSRKKREEPIDLIKEAKKSEMLLEEYNKSEERAKKLTSEGKKLTILDDLVNRLMGMLKDVSLKRKYEKELDKFYSESKEFLEKKGYPTLQLTKIYQKSREQLDNLLASNRSWEEKMELYRKIVSTAKVEMDALMVKQSKNLFKNQRVKRTR